MFLHVFDVAFVLTSFAVGKTFGAGFMAVREVLFGQYLIATLTVFTVFRPSVIGVTGPVTMLQIASETK